jgi:hypothetical protein
MNESNQTAAALRIRLLQKIFIMIIPLTYILQTVTQLRRVTNDTKLFTELLIISLVPVGYFLFSYLTISKKISRLTSIFQSLLAAIVTYIIWTTVVNIIQSFHAIYDGNITLDFVTALIVAIILATSLISLRKMKLW